MRNMDHMLLEISERVQELIRTTTMSREAIVEQVQQEFPKHKELVEWAIL